MNITSWLDFWTTNSTIWFNDWIKTELIHLWTVKKETRTVLLIDEEENEVVVWTEWIDRYITWTEWRLLQSPKSYLKSREEVRVDILWKSCTLTEVIWIIISNFKKKLEIVLDYEIDSVLLWRPVNFHDTDQNLDRLAQDRLELAAKIAWFKNIEFQLEPLAAAKNYQITLNSWIEENVFIVDLWWWTSDFSILNMTNKKMFVIWNKGIYIWWNDFDKKLSLNFFCELLWKWGTYKFFWSDSDIPSTFYRTLSDWKKIHELGTPNNRNKIKELFWSSNDKIKFWRLKDIAEDYYLGYQYFKWVEWTKKMLSTLDTFSWNFDFFSNPFHFDISRKEFEEMISNELELITKTIKELLLQSWIKAENINKIFVTWGSSLVPIIRECVNSILWKWKIVNWDTFSSVWYWLSLESWEIFK